MLRSSLQKIIAVLSTVALCTSLSACGVLETPTGLALTPGISPGSSVTRSARFESLAAQGKGGEIAAFALQNTSGGTGWCYSHVAQAIHSAYPAFLQGEHAYMAANQLAQSNSFQEVNSLQLQNLPAGAVVVWSQGTSNSGHISIADGNGREISDHIAPQMQQHYGGGSPRVFLPR